MLVIFCKLNYRACYNIFQTDWVLGVTLNLMQNHLASVVTPPSSTPPLALSHSPHSSNSPQPCPSPPRSSSSPRRLAHSPFLLSPPGAATVAHSNAATARLTLFKSPQRPAVVANLWQHHRSYPDMVPEHSRVVDE